MASDSDPRPDLRTLPDLEVFEFNPAEHAEVRPRAQCENCGETATLFSGSHDGAVCRPCATGWYWWSCLPGCLPDGGADGTVRDRGRRALGRAGRPG